MITRLRVKNFKCLRDVSVDLDPFTVLIGKNDTGKTSLLEAIHILSRMIAGDAARALQGPWALENLLSIGASSTAGAIGYEVDLAPSARTRLEASSSYKLSISPSPIGGAVHVQDEEISVDGRPDIRLGFSDTTPAFAYAEEQGSEGKFHGTVRSDPVLSRARAWSLPALTAIASSLTSGMSYALSSDQLMRAAAYDPDNPDREPRMTSGGYGLPLVLDALAGSDRISFAKLEAELQVLVPNVRSIQLKPWSSRGEPSQVFIGKKLEFVLSEMDRSAVPAPLMSDGVFLILGYLALAYAPSSPAIMLLEEPENGVHPRALANVANLLRRITEPGRGSKQAQVIVTTHSPYLLDFVPPESVRVFARKSTGETVIGRLTDLPMVRARLEAGYSLGELWFNVGEEQLLRDLLNAAPTVE